MVEVIQFVVLLIWVALAIAFLLGLANPKTVIPWQENPTRVDVLLLYLLTPNILIFIGILVWAGFDISDTSDKITVAIITPFLIFASLIVIGLIKPSFVIRWGNLRDRTRVLLYYGTPALLIIVVTLVLQQTVFVSLEQEAARKQFNEIVGSAAIGLAAQEGLDCGDYYAKDWGQPMSLFMNDNLRHVAGYNQCDVYLETIETSWGTLYRTLIFVDRRLQGVEMVAVSNGLSSDALFTRVVGPCFTQHGTPEIDKRMTDVTGINTVKWYWVDRNIGVAPTVVMARKAVDNRGVNLLVGRGGSGAPIITYFNYYRDGHILGLEDLLGMHSN